MNKKAINVDDMVFARLEKGGRVIATLAKTNFASVADVVTAIRQSAGQFMGMAQLTIRNKTQGWNMQLALANARRPIFAA